MHRRKHFLLHGSINAHGLMPPDAWSGKFEGLPHGRRKMAMTACSLHATHANSCAVCKRCARVCSLRPRCCAAVPPTRGDEDRRCADASRTVAQSADSSSSSSWRQRRRASAHSLRCVSFYLCSAFSLTHRNRITDRRRQTNHRVHRHAIKAETKRGEGVSALLQSHIASGSLDVFLV